ncbi:hypothetical protein MMC11_001045 [Xylographa trunciseda]|nr:hypothetical protein [Xylographa trunciseda]
MPPSPSLAFYPAYCFPASPTFSTWAKLTAADVHALTTREGFEAQKIHFYLNHPIKWIRLVGVIVAFDVSDYRFTFCLDDSSGQTVEVTCPRDRTGARPPTKSTPSAATSKTPAPSADLKGRTLSGISIDLAGIDVGSVVKVKGGVGAFRGEPQVELERITPIHTTTAEAAAWREAMLFHSTILSAPWSLTPDEQHRLKDEADGTAQRAEEKLRRKAERETRRRKRAEREKTTQTGRQKRPDRDGNMQGRGQKRRVSDKENEGV